MLITTVNKSIELAISFNDARELCRRIVRDIGWGVLEEKKASLKIKEESSSSSTFKWPVEVELIISSINVTTSLVKLKGKVFGSGSSQKSHLLSHLECIKKRFDTAVRVDGNT